MMALFTSTPPAGISPAMLSCAAHELGHLFTFRHFGIPTYDIRVTSQGPDYATGGVVVDDDDITPELMPGYLVGLMAGFEAACLWADKHGLAKPGAHTWVPTDRKEFDRCRRKVRGMNERKAAGLARPIVRVYWGDIKRLTPVLAKAGSLARV